MENKKRERNFYGIITYAICVAMIFTACYAVIFFPIKISHYFKDFYYVMNGFFGWLLIRHNNPYKFKNRTAIWFLSTLAFYYLFSPLTLCVGLYKCKFFYDLKFED